jgi:hypothetical protein
MTHTRMRTSKHVDVRWKAHSEDVYFITAMVPSTRIWTAYIIREHRYGETLDPQSSNQLLVLVIQWTQ